MSHGLYENQKLNQTKLDAIKQHVESNKHNLMKKLQFLQKSLLNEEKRLNEVSQFSGGSIDSFLDKMKSKLKGEFSLRE